MKYMYLFCYITQGPTGRPIYASERGDVEPDSNGNIFRDRLLTTLIEKVEAEQGAKIAIIFFSLDPVCISTRPAPTGC